MLQIRICIRITASFVKISVSRAVSNNEWSDETLDGPEAMVNVMLSNNIFL